MSGCSVAGLLFAQAANAVKIEAGSADTLPTWALVGGMILVGVLLLVLVPTVLGLRHSRWLREVDHAERMRAMELGHPLPGTIPDAGGSAPVGVKIGLWVPISVFGIAFVASQSGHGHSEAWIAAAIVGSAAVICGTILTLKAPAPTAPIPGPAAKPLIDPAAYEELASRH